MFFRYGESETDYLKKRDKRLGAAIEKIGHIERKTESDLFASVVRHIVGQQISTKAQATVWARLSAYLGEVTPKTVAAVSADDLQKNGISYRKAEYIKDFAEKISRGEFDLDAVSRMNDEDAIKSLASLKGIGVWTAEMLLLFSLERKDILSFDDLAIIRGIRMLYGKKNVTRAEFEKLRRRYSPYGSIASLYLWAVAGGAIAELTDPKESKNAKKETAKKAETAHKEDKATQKSKSSHKKDKSTQKSIASQKTTKTQTKKENTSSAKSVYTMNYSSPLGKLLVAADEQGLIGLWFYGQKYFPDKLKSEKQNARLSVFDETKSWLDLYFAGKKPLFTPKLHLTGSEFRLAVWQILLEIPYGETITYGEIATKLSTSGKKMSAQAVGGAVGHNPISIIVPCHRVVGTSGSLTGYAGGIDKKVALLKNEKCDLTKFFVP